MPDVTTDSPLIKRIVIAGGGTAGWMAAAMFQHVLRQSVDIVLIESEDIGTVGVGEATIPPILNLLKFLGLNENEVISKVQGTFKLGIDFVDWHKKGHSYRHNFGTPGQGLGVLPFHQYWLRLKGKPGLGSLWDYSFNEKACRANKFARISRIPDTPMEGLAYALHFDAGLLAAYLRKHCETLGVKRREGLITGVNLDSDTGFIRSLTLGDGEEIEADFFIDCSGFRGLLIEGALKAGYEDWTHWLKCDRAVAVPCESVSPLLPYTRATAHTAGWQWRIPLQHRTGNGHVFSSAYMDEDKATQILLDNLDGKPLVDPRTLKFTTGRRKALWVKNCVALGLASGFMEPLESTSIHMVQSAINRIVKSFPNKGFSPLEIAEYNRQTAEEYEHIRDFIILHYKATMRDDSDFWNDCRSMDIPDSLAHKMEHFREHGRPKLSEADLFKEASWVQVLLGQGIIPRSYSPLTHAVDEASLDDYFQNITQIHDRTIAQLPTHEAFIAQNCKA